MPSHFTTTRRVQFSETDMAGIVHFANFYRYMEEAEHEFFRSFGRSIMERQPDGSIIGWPRVSAQCNYQAPAYYEDVLEIRSFVDRIGVKSLTMRYEFWRGETKIARGQMKIVCCLFRQDEPMQSIAIPPEFADHLEEIPVDAAQQ